MPYDVKLPDIGEGVAEGEIVRWLVKPGESVREDQPLVEVMTDKASVEIPSPRTGTIAALHGEEGAVIPVGTVIVSIRLPGESETSAAVAPASVGSQRSEGGHGTQGAGAPRGTAPPGAAGAATATGRVQATPAVRQLAKQQGVALESVTGTGPGGAITAEDVKAAAGTASATGVATGSRAPDSAATATAADAATEERVPFRGLRRKIAEHMRRSIENAAHFTFVAECDMSELVERRERVKRDAEGRGVKLTVLAYVVKALVESLRGYPQLNAVLDEAHGEIVLKRRYHVGIATHTDEGLTVPVVHDVDRLSVLEIAREIQRLSQAAREKRLELEDLQGGTFTVTSTGAQGGVLATPILHHPQVAILGVHEIKKRPAVVAGAIVPRDLCNFSLSLDHRVVDGAVGAQFLYDLIARLERPAAWVGEEDRA